MKRMLAIAACLLMLFSSFAVAEEVVGPIAMEDFRQITDTGLDTVGDYANALNPTGYTWYFEGEATGITYFTLAVSGGSLVLKVVDAEDYQDDDSGLEGADALAGDVLKMPAELKGASWENDMMSYAFLPRGLQLGDSKEKLAETIQGLEFTETPSDDGDGFDEVASCLLTVPDDPDEWHEYYGLDFFLRNGEIELAQFWYSTDAE